MNIFKVFPSEDTDSGRGSEGSNGVSENQGQETNLLNVTPSDTGTSEESSGVYTGLVMKQ